jgi:hypothetical protein
VREVVFFHQSLQGFGDEAVTLARAIFDAPPTVLWYVYGHWPKFCTLTKDG